MGPGALEVGSVYTRAGVRIDRESFNAYRREVTQAREQSKREIEQRVGARVDKGSFEKAKVAQDETAKSSHRLGGSWVSAREKIGPLHAGVRGLTGALIGGVGVIGLWEAVKMSADRFKEQQTESAKLDASLKSTGNTAHTSAKQIDAMATSIQRKTGIDGEQVRSAAQTLLAFRGIRNELGKGNDVYNQAIQSATDLSVKFGRDVQPTAIMLGKALNDPVKGLGALNRIGLKVSDSTKAQITNLVAHGKTLEAQKIILAAVNRAAGGQAEAYGKTLPGAISKAKLAFEDLGARLISKVAPALTTAVGSVAKFVSQMESGQGSGGRFAKTVGQIASAVWSVLKPIGLVIGQVVVFVGKHPALLKVAAAIIAVGLAVKALRFTAALTGIDKVLVGLKKIATSRAGEAAARAIGGGLSKLPGFSNGPLGKFAKWLEARGKTAGRDAGEKQAVAQAEAGSGTKLAKQYSGRWGRFKSWLTGASRSTGRVAGEEQGIAQAEGATGSKGLGGGKARGMFGKVGRGLGVVFGAALAAAVIANLPQLEEQIASALGIDKGQLHDEFQSAKKEGTGGYLLHTVTGHPLDIPPGEVNLPRPPIPRTVPLPGGGRGHLVPIHNSQGVTIGYRTVPIGTASHKPRTRAHRQHGGSIPGYGGGDIWPTWLEPGEHVVTKEEVAGAGGHGVVDRIRAMMRAGISHYQHGGAAGGGMAALFPPGSTAPDKKAAKDLHDKTTAEFVGIAGDADKQWKATRKHVKDHTEGARDDGVKATKDLHTKATKELTDLAGDADKQGKKLADKLTGHLDDARVAANTKAKAIAHDLGGRFDAVSGDADTSFRHVARVVQSRLEDAHQAATSRARAIAQAIHGGFTSSDQATSTGLGYIARATADALKALGAKPPAFNVPAPPHAGGGIPNPGGGARDDHLLLDPRGRPVAAMSGTEGIINTPQMLEVNRWGAIAKTLGVSRFGSLGELWRSGMQHYAGGGKLGNYSAMIGMANAITKQHYPYRWGGGHDDRFSGPYDCSGAVSAVLHAGGLLDHPLVAADFMNYGTPGSGLVTLYANSGHVYMSMGGRFFGTSLSNPGGGADWFNGKPRPGFVRRNVPVNANTNLPRVRVRGPAGALRGAAQGSIDTTRNAGQGRVRAAIKSMVSRLASGKGNAGDSALLGPGGWAKVGATIDPTMGQPSAGSGPHGGWSFAELLVAGANAHLRNQDLAATLGLPNGPFGMPMGTRLLVREPGGKVAFPAWKNDVGSGQAGDPHFKLDAHQRLADAVHLPGKGDVEVKAAGMGGLLRRFAGGGRLSGGGPGGVLSDPSVYSTGIAKATKQIDRLNSRYDALSGRFDLTDEASAVVVEGDPTATPPRPPTINQGLWQQHYTELAQLFTVKQHVDSLEHRIQDYTVNLLTIYRNRRHRVAETINAVKRALRRLGKGKRGDRTRASLTKRLGQYTKTYNALDARVRGLGDSKGSVDLDVYNADTDVQAARDEIKAWDPRQLLAGPLADFTGQIPATPDAGAGAGDAGATDAAAIAAAAIAQVQAFRAAQQQTFQQFGSNFTAAGVDPFLTAAGRSAGFGYFGAAGATGSGGIEAGTAAAAGGVYVNGDVVNHFPESPGDPHQWLAGQRFILAGYGG